MTFTPDAGENALASNLNNHYLNATAQYVLPYLKVAWVPCTRPVFEKWKWGQQAYGPQTWNQDPTWMFPLTSGVVMQSGNGVVDATSEFTSNALSVLEPLTGGSTTTFFVESAGARNVGTSKVITTVMTPVAGTSNVVLSDALVASGSQVDAVAAVSGDVHNTISYAVLEALDSETGRLYALTNNGGTEGLTTVDVSGALNNFLYAQSSVSLSGTTFSTALALEYSQANSKLYLLDRLASGDVYYLRLSSITTAGVMTELWRTTGVSLSSFPTAFLSATPPQGSLVVSLQSGSTAEAMLIDGSGNPTGSYYASGSITSSAMLGAGGGVWFPFENSDPGSGLHSLAPMYQPLLLDGICGSSWLLAHAGSSGELSTSKASCNAIYNGGFETGTFLDWTTIGQLETISSNAHAGHFSAMLGSTAPTNGDSTVTQTFTVPSAGGTLGFYWSSTCPDTVTYDWFTATLQNTSGATLATIVSKTCAASSAWTHATLNLSTWQGQTVVVVLTSHDDNFVGDATYSFVDDVVVQ